MIEHSRRAQLFAERLEAMGLGVRYPGLVSHPQHELFKRLANPEFGAGGIIALDLGTSERASKLMEALQLDERFGFIAVSLGYFDTLMSASATSTSSELPQEERWKAGLSDGLLRMSVGYTGSLEQRWEQLERAVKKVL
jgi:methionine-gamma-lyase